MAKRIKLENIITPKDLIKTKHSNSYDWVTTVSLGCFGRYLEVEMVETYLVKVLMIGDKLTCKYYAKDFVYILKAVVFNIKINTQSIVLKVNSVEEVNNTRSSKRFEVYLCASINTSAKVGEGYAVVTNISNSGISIITRECIEVGQIIEINIFFTSFNIVSFQCEVMWSKIIGKNNIYGFKITDINEINKFRYEEYIRVLEINEKKVLTTN